MIMVVTQNSLLSRRFLASISSHIAYGLHVTWQTPVEVSKAWGKYLRLNHKAALTKVIRADTYTSGPIMQFYRKAP